MRKPHFFKNNVMFLGTMCPAPHAIVMHMTSSRTGLGSLDRSVQDLTSPLDGCSGLTECSKHVEHLIDRSHKYEQENKESCDIGQRSLGYGSTYRPNSNDNDKAQLNRSS